MSATFKVDEGSKMAKFHEMGFDDRLLKAIARLGWKEPTLIQERAIPLILEGKDVLARARTGSGKTGAYALPAIQKLLSFKSFAREQAIRAVVLAPSKELCHQIYNNFMQLTAFCTKDMKVLDVTSTTCEATIKTMLSEKPDIIVTTPTKLLSHLQKGNLEIKDSLEILVIDEADLVFSFGYEDDVKKMLGFLPQVYQSVLASATLSSDVIDLKNLVLHNPVILKLQEPPVPSSCQLAHYVIRAEEEDKFVLIYALFKLRLVRGKSLIFVNTVDRSYKLKLFLEQFGISSCVLNSELPQMSRWHTVQQFNLGAYNIIIASDDRMLDEKAAETEPTKEESEEAAAAKKAGNKRKDKESGVSRGIDFQFLSNVINFDFPLDSASYLHRVGRTARGNNQGAALSLVSLKEEELLGEVEEALKDLLGDAELKMKPFNFKMSEVEGFRYRAKDAWKSVTRIAIREARIKEIRLEIMNSNKLKTYFESNPHELRALRHDKALKTVKQQPHLRNVPDYIIPKTLKHLPVSRSTGDGSVSFSSSSSSQRKKKRGAFKKGGTSKKRKADPLQSLEFKGLNKKKSRKTAEEI